METARLGDLLKTATPGHCRTYRPTGPRARRESAGTEAVIGKGHLDVTARREAALLRSDGEAVLIIHGDDFC